MTANKLQAVAAAFLLSTAALGAGALLATVPAYAQGLRPEVGLPPAGCGIRCQPRATIRARWTM